MHNNFSFENNLLYKNGGYFASFVSDIEKILVFESSLVVLLKYSPSIGNQNIYCLDFEGGKIWQIIEPIEVHTENYFSSIYLREDELYAYNINGAEYHLNRQTGDPLSIDMIK